MGPERFRVTPPDAHESGRAKTWIERNARERGELSDFVHPIHIWLLKNDDAASLSHKETVATSISGIAEHSTQRVDDERALQTTALNRKELRYALEYTFDRNHHATTLPDLVVLDQINNRDNYALPKECAPLAHTYLDYYLRPIDDIRAAADKYHKYMLHNGLPEWVFHENDAIDQALVDEVFRPPAIDIDQPATRENAMDEVLCALVDDESYGELLPAVRRYIENNDMSLIERYLSDECLRRAIARIQHINEDAIFDEYPHDPETGDPAPREDGVSAEQEIAYREQVARISTSFDMTGLRTYLLAALRRGIDGFKDKMLLDEDFERWTRRVLQPIIASVSPNISFQRHALEHGAHAIPRSLTPEDMERLATMAARTKDDWQSMVPERVQRFKQQFYERHEADLDERATMTADTEQELRIVREVLKTEQRTDTAPLHILDVGSGTGRIAIPLGEQYTVTGIEANAHFWERAQERMTGETRFIAGDMINYKASVEHEHFDAVTYTWHSFLEAYGIGNTLETLTSAWLALKPGGVLILDMPTRENAGMEDGWYEYCEDTGPGYLAHIMDRDELTFTLRMAGFDTDAVDIREWSARPTNAYPEGMKKWTVVVHKPRHVAIEGVCKIFCVNGLSTVL